MVKGRAQRLAGQDGAGDARADALAQRRRADIIDATMAVIARQGLSNTTIERVALQAGVSPGLVIVYFKRKELLLLEALKTVAAEFEDARRKAIASATADGRTDPVKALDALITMTFDAKVSAPERVAVWYAFWGEANARRVYLDLVGKQDDTYLADLVGLFAQLKAEGGYPDLDAEAVAVGFAGSLDWQWQEILIEGRQFDRRRAARITRAYLAGLFPRHFSP
jgi:TetR/AcrR family transcriptional regulator, transcriptional repressor of bet genes